MNNTGPTSASLTMRYQLRTLLIVLALGPPVLAFGWWGCAAWRKPDTHIHRPLQDLENRYWPEELRLSAGAADASAGR